MSYLRSLLRTAATATVAAILLLAIYGLWIRYQVEPLTRDGKVRADIVPIAGDVAGLVTEVRVSDNETVRKGQLLFTIDRPRFQFALDQAEAKVGSERVALEQAMREERRNRAMPEVVAAETVEQGEAKVEALKTALSEATAVRNLAQLNLERTLVRAPVDGTVTNVTLQPGVYLNVGKVAMALVYEQSLRVEAYFEETKLPAVHVGDPASVHLMGVSDEIEGHVESISAGIEDRERTGSESNLANINPAFTWVRLAQRIPVRITIDRPPPGVRLVPGQTATVEVHSRRDDPPAHRSFPW
jgi:RND family efflux transporter MFP subunit